MSEKLCFELTNNEAVRIRQALRLMLKMLKEKQSNEATLNMWENIWFDFTAQHKSQIED